MQSGSASRRASASRSSDAAASGRVEVEEGVVFGSGGGRELRCDIFRPPVPREDGKSVLLIHGGAWFQGDRSQLRGYGILLGRLGYLCVSTEYRLSGESKWPAQLHDVKACLRYMRRESEALGIDPEKISVWGNSAGGHLALLLAGTQDDPRFEGCGGSEGISTRVNACVAFYPPSRVGPENRADGLIPALFEADATDATLAEASPVQHVSSADFPPTLLIHGNRDRIVPVRSSLEIYERLMSVGARVELHIFSEAPHGFDAGRELGRPAAELCHLFLERHT